MEEKKNIFHSGVLGMKWGVRKDRTNSPSKTYVRGKLVDAKTSVRGEIVDKKIVRTRVSVSDVVKKLKAHIDKVNAEELKKHAANEASEAKLIDAGNKYQKDKAAGKALKDQGSENLRSPTSRAQYELGKAQFRAGEEAMRKADMDFDLAYASLPKHQTTLGEKVALGILATVVVVDAVSRSG